MILDDSLMVSAISPKSEEIKEQLFSPEAAAKKRRNIKIDQLTQGCKLNKSAKDYTANDNIV